MRIDVNFYIINKPFVQKWFIDQGTLGPAEGSSIMACALHVPVIVCNLWIGEVSGWKEETLDTIENLIKFYGYTQIDNVPDGYPGRKL